MKPRVTLPAILSFIIFIFMYKGCGTFVGNPGQETEVPGEEESLRVYITDAPSEFASQVFMKIKRIQVSEDGIKWYEINVTHSEPFDILSFQDGLSLKLATAFALPEIHIKKVRVFFDEEHQIIAKIAVGNLEAKIPIPEKLKAGMDIELDIKVEKGQSMSITLDFDMRRSIQLNEQKVFEFKPFFRAVDNSKVGRLVGRVKGNARFVCAFGSQRLLLDDDGTCQTSVTTATVRDGKYTLAFLPEDRYYLRFLDIRGRSVAIEKDGTTVTIGNENTVREIIAEELPDVPAPENETNADDQGNTSKSESSEFVPPDDSTDNSPGSNQNNNDDNDDNDDNDGNQQPPEDVEGFVVPVDPDN